MATDAQADLLDLIYQAAVRSTLWNEVSVRIGAMIGADAGIMMVPASFGGPPIPLAAFGLDLAAIADAYPQFAGRATLTNLTLATGRAPGIFTLEDLLPASVRETHEVWVKLCEPMGWKTGLICVLRLPQETGGRPVILNFFRRGDRAEFSEADAEILKDLFPHLRRSLDLALARPLESMPATLVQLVRALPDACLLVGAMGQVLVANEAVEALARQGQYTLVRRGRLVLDDSSAQKRLTQALANSARLDWFSHLYPGTELVARLEGGNLMISVAPIPARDPLSAPTDRPVALVRIIVPGGQGSNRGLTRFRDLFGLSQAETEVAAAIGDRLSVRDIAERRGVTEGTTRLQIKAVFAKTGVNRQSALAALVTDVRR